MFSFGVRFWRLVLTLGLMKMQASSLALRLVFNVWSCLEALFAQLFKGLVFAFRAVVSFGCCSSAVILIRNTVTHSLQRVLHNA